VNLSNPQASPAYPDELPGLNAIEILNHRTPKDWHENKAKGPAGYPV
jgi:hypothetical protein